MVALLEADYNSGCETEYTLYDHGGQSWGSADCMYSLLSASIHPSKSSGLLQGIHDPSQPPTSIVNAGSPGSPCHLAVPVGGTHKHKHSECGTCGGLA